ncbi:MULTISPECIES: inhibitor of vertebrate lysozyme family protein [Yersinia]|uniref:inhibitor of vertebrate lysozyme family protein n=1 Tax=Yersinia TaxID=629 RepID=UPI000BFBD232|nr:MULTISPECIES: inhibitor of vertebrate lysozyme family protein [Yersinia]ATM86908.1 inhibitor of vertebrate lysozyme [Yersinia frederiksenii]MCB5318282.1 inhibitor of vertebrate lysozyme family protein [Yersinia massiliensis]
MKGRKTRHCLVAAAILSVHSWAFAQPVSATPAVSTTPDVSAPPAVTSPTPAPVKPLPTTADLLQQPVYKNSWQKMTKSQKNLPAWARKGVGTSGPYEIIHWEGKPYKVGRICKPHDCSNNFMWVAFSQNKKQVWQAWGMRITVDNKPQAMDNPSQFATYQWLGHPDEVIQAMLKNQLQQDPNWR